MKQVAFAIVITYCALFGFAERAQAATLQELFDGASISALDKDFTDWKLLENTGAGFDPSKIEVTPLEDQPLNPGLLFKAERGAAGGVGARSIFSFSYTVTSNGNPIKGNELELIDFIFEDGSGELGPASFLIIEDSVNPANQNNVLGFNEVLVTQRDQVLFDELGYQSPEQSLDVENILQVNGTPSGIAQINQYSQRFSQVPIPAAVWLLGGGLIGLLGLRRRIKS